MNGRKRGAKTKSTNDQEGEGVIFARGIRERKNGFHTKSHGIKS
jgi:hypothetical protein